MQLPKWIRNIWETPTNPDFTQTYQDDKKYIYNLIFINEQGERWSRVFSSSVPLEPNHRIALAPKKSFTVTHIVHVIYPKEESESLTRPTTFVHARVIITSDSNTQESELDMLGFSIVDTIFPQTIH
mgnify:CR=1 FL=1|tara:strand:- start:76 stop:456 length:381 start_codon:yes stop_codon:yes gene_type:complete